MQVEAPKLHDIFLLREATVFLRSWVRLGGVSERLGALPESLQERLQPKSPRRRPYPEPPAAQIPAQEALSWGLRNGPGASGTQIPPTNPRRFSFGGYLGVSWGGSAFSVASSLVF